MTRQKYQQVAGCIYIYIYIYIYIHIYTHTHIHTHTYTHTYIYTYIYIHTHIHTHTHMFEGPRAIFNFLNGVRVSLAYERVFLLTVLYIRIFVLLSRQIGLITLLHVSTLCAQIAGYFVLNLAVHTWTTRHWSLVCVFKPHVPFTHAPCLVPLDVMILVIFYKSVQSSSLCIYLHPPVTCSLRHVPSILLSLVFWVITFRAHSVAVYAVQLAACDKIWSTSSPQSAIYCFLRRNTNKMQLVIEFIIPEFIEGSTCCERHIAHHQELYTVYAASGLYTHVVTGCCQGSASAVCRSKHVQPSVNFGIINSITTCILLVFLLSHTTMHGSMNIKFRF